MKCPKCNASKLIAVHPQREGYGIMKNSRFYQIGDKWVAADPANKSYLYSTRYKFQILCKCGHSWDEYSIENQYSPAISHKEITLDLDHTLFNVDFPAPGTETYDFTFTCPDLNKGTYYVTKRKHLDFFISELLKRFEKINIFTGASESYAWNLVNKLNIPKDKLGYVRTSKDGVSGRAMCAIYEKMSCLKMIDDSLVVEDTPNMIYGFNNTIIQVPPFYYHDDDELLKVLSYLNQKEERIKKPQVISGEVRLLTKQVEISFKDVPFDVYKDLLEVPARETDKGPFVIMSNLQTFFVLDDNEAEIVYGDVEYNSYLKILELLKDYTDHVKMDQTEFDSILKNRKKLNNNF